MKPASRLVALRLVCFMVPCLLAFWPTSIEASHETKEVNTITADRVKLLLEAGEKPVLIDLRPVKEFKQKRLPGARSIPMTEVHKRLEEIPRAGRVVLYSTTPRNEIIDEVYQYLDDQGYRNVAVMVEGFQGWVKRKYPIESGR